MELLQNKKDYEKTLRFVSWDKQNKVSLIEKEDIVYDFDGITKFLCGQFYSKQALASCDAFLQCDNEYYFMEFKNQTAQRIKSDEIKKKAFMSFVLFRLEMDQAISVDDARKRSTLFVVFRDDDPPRAPSNDENTMEDKTATDTPQPKLDRAAGEAVKSSSYDAFVDKLGQLAKIEETTPILFGLRKMKGKFYRQIYTITKSEFMNKWYPQLFSGT